MSQRVTRKNTTNSIVCAHCSKSTLNKDVILCDKCNSYYDLKCADITVSLFNEIKKMKNEKTKSSLFWQCTNCSKSNTANNDNNELLDKNTASLEVLFNKFERKITNILDAKIESVINSKVNEAVKGLSDSIKDLQQEYIILKQKMKDIENNMESKLNELSTSGNVENERRERLNHFVIYGVPVAITGNDILQIVERICIKYDKNFCKDNVQCFRLNNDNNYPPILVKFFSRSARDAVFFNYIKKRDLMLSDVAEGNEIQHRIYINEHLAKQDASIVRECRTLKADKKIQYFFLRNGKIFILIAGNNNKIGPIKNISQLKACTTASTNIDTSNI